MTAGNILPITQARKVMQFNAIQEVRAYWEGLRSGRLVPLRSDVDPRGIENALEYAFIIERVAPSIARFRLAGMHLTDLMGMEVRGMPLTSFIAPQARQDMANTIEAVFQGPAIAEIQMTAEYSMGKPSLTARMIILPLKSDLGDVSRAIGCLVSDGDIGRTPRRFDQLDIQMSEITAGLPVQSLKPAPSLAPAPGFAERVTPFDTSKKPKRGAHLRLVK